VSAPAVPTEPAQPASCTELFLTFTGLALQGFGGVLAVAQRVLVERKRWLTHEQFVEVLALAQVLPGPNVCNISLMVGDRYFGLRGAFAALAGMMAVPLALVLAATALYQHYAELPAVAGALRGMGAVAAGLIIGTALTLGRSIATSPLGRVAWLAAAAATFALIGLVRLPLVWVLPALGLVACTWAWHRVGARL
jgi:chromate transporter